MVRMFVPTGLDQVAAERVRALIIGGAYAHNVSEAILAGAEPERAARLCLPPARWQAWSDGRQPVAAAGSIWLFALFVFGRLRLALRDFLVLWRNARNGLAAPSGSYCVAMKVAPLTVASAKTGGFLPWLLRAAPFRKRPQTIWVLPQVAVQAVIAGNEFKVVGVPFPKLENLGPRLRFAWETVALFAVSALAMLCGRWQLAVLLPDLISCRYLARMDDKVLPEAFVFTINDLADRPLWSWLAEQRGCEVPIVFYASSYSLFGYGIEPVRDIQHPSLLEGNWSTGWYQAEPASRMLRAWGDRTPGRRVVGGFDMFDDGCQLPQLPDRWIAVFDTEPVAQISRLAERGYICPFLEEDVVVSFWEELGRIAKDLGLVLVHKPKRPHAHMREVRYRRILARLQAEGCYVPLPTGFGPMRLVEKAPASVLLPFTSVGDIVSAVHGKTMYFDVFGTIRDPEAYPTGLEVAATPQALRAWLTLQLGTPESSTAPKRTSA